MASENGRHPGHGLGEMTRGAMLDDIVVRLLCEHGAEVERLEEEKRRLDENLQSVLVKLDDMIQQRNDLRVEVDEWIRRATEAPSLWQDTKTFFVLITGVFSFGIAAWLVFVYGRSI
jgi:hypothetical protein